MNGNSANNNLDKTRQTKGDKSNNLKVKYENSNIEFMWEVYDDAGK
jgi:hypothetical protein